MAQLKALYYQNLKILVDIMEILFNISSLGGAPSSIFSFGLLSKPRDVSRGSGNTFQYFLLGGAHSSI
jgi:hypothetical protein